MVGEYTRHMSRLPDSPRVLVVEDDAALSEVVCTFLGDEGYACVPAFSGTEALLLAERAADAKKNQPFDLVILDLMLPGVPGEELIGRLRAVGVSAPVIVTSARSAVTDRVGMLRLGASDYLVKPFDLDELLARVEVQLRGRTVAAPAPETLRFGRWELDPAARTFAVDGEQLRLTRTEFDIIAALMREPSRVFTKQALFELVRNEEALTEERTISTHVSNLRVKLRPSGTDAYIQTVWGIGFKLQA